MDSNGNPLRAICAPFPSLPLCSSLTHLYPYAQYSVVLAVMRVELIKIFTFLSDLVLVSVVPVPRLIAFL
jgi:hypothetical protein